MGKEAFSRALMSVGGGLEKMAGNEAQSERDQAQAMRAMSMQRLRGEQSKESAEIRAKATSDAAETRATAVSDASAANIAARSTEADKRRTFDTEQNAANRSYQDKRLDMQKLKAIGAQSTAAIEGIDMQISKARELLQKASLELGGANPEGVAKIEADIAALEQQKPVTAYSFLMQRKLLGDPLYKDKDKYDLMKDAGYPKEAVDAKKKRDTEAENQTPEVDTSDQFVPDGIIDASGEPISTAMRDIKPSEAAPAAPAAAPARELMAEVNPEASTANRRSAAGSSEHGFNADYNANPFKSLSGIQDMGKSRGEDFLRQQKIRVAMSKQANGEPLTPEEQELLAQQVASNR